MTLQFDASAYLAAFKNHQQQEQYAPEMYAQGMQGVGKGIETLAGIPDQERQKRMQQLLTGLKFQEQGIDPTSALSYIQSGQIPQTSPEAPSLTPEQGSSLMPSMRPGQGLEASAGVSDAPRMPQPSGSPTPIMQSPIVAAHKQYLSQGQQQGQQPGIQSLFQRKPIDSSRLDDVNYLMSLPENQRSLVEKKKEFDQRQAEQQAKAADSADYDPQDLTDAQSGNFQGIASRHGGKIPHGFASLAETASGKATTAYEKKVSDAQNAMINVRGDQSIARTELQRDAAAMAYNTIERIKSENRMPTPLEYHDLLNQMLKARTGAYSEQAARDLDQKTLQGDTGKLYSYFTGKTAPATTKDLLQNLQNFVSESGVQAEKQHEAYMSPRQLKILQGLKKEDQDKILNTHRGLSFQEQTGYKDSNSPQVGEIRKGYRFKGGDPSQQTSWEKQ